MDNLSIPISEKRRHFGGQLFVPPDENGKRSPANKALSNFEKKHLKAYLRGDEGFAYGYDKLHKPLWFVVVVNWF